MSYSDLYELVLETAAVLRAHGVERDDRVAIVLPNGPEMAAAFLAVASCATAAPLNPAYRAPEFDFYLQDLEAKLLVVAPGTGEAAVAVAESRGVPVCELHARTDGPAGLFDLRASTGLAPPAGDMELSKPDDVGLVLHTSGTTSKPKIVPLSQKNLCASARNVGASLALTPDDVCLNIMPLFHIHGLVAALLASVRAGASVSCTPGFVATEFFSWLADTRPTWYTARADHAPGHPCACSGATKRDLHESASFRAIVVGVLASFGDGGPRT